MSQEDSAISHVSDTALMVAACRAMETTRSDGFVRDPFAERLAGARGMAITRAVARRDIMCFGVGMRSRLVDDLVVRAIATRRISTVLSLGCGLDSRPWRLDLPASLHWIEVDFPAILDYKTQVMALEKPRCRLQRMPADLGEPSQRRAVYAAAAETLAMMITEGLLIYLASETIEALASEPPVSSGIRYWLADVVSPVVAAAVGIDADPNIQKVRAAGHLDGQQILDTMRRNGWETVEHRSYLRDVWDFAGERILAARRNAPAGPPQPQPAPDDFTGIHLLGRRPTLIQH